MSAGKADAFVFYGATGDLAYKKIFPALQGLIRRGALDVPIVGVAKERWTLEQLQARAMESLDKHGGIDRAAAARMTQLLRYVGGDYEDPATFAALRHALRDAASRGRTTWRRRGASSIQPSRPAPPSTSTSRARGDRRRPTAWCRAAGSWRGNDWVAPTSPSGRDPDQRCVARPAIPRAWYQLAFGRVNRKVAPGPSFASAQSRPPWS